MSNKKIVILGSGLSGMIMALGLASRGLSCTIIELSHLPKNVKDLKLESIKSDNRTTALTFVSSEVLSDYGIWSELEALSGKMLDIYVLDSKSNDMVHLHGALKKPQHNALGYIVPNREFKHVLLKKILSNPLITFIDNSSYEIIENHKEHTKILLSSGKEIICDLVIVCDGQNSKAKNQYFSDKVNKAYKQVALTFNVKHELKHDGTAVEHFMSGGPFAILPLLSGYHSSIVWTLKEEVATVFKNLPFEELEYHLNQNFGNFLGKVQIEGEINSFPLKARITSSYFSNRIVVAADTAHIVHPLAGQGLNQGIKDIKALVDLLADHKILDQSLLKTYQRMREDDNLEMYHLTDLINGLFSNESYLLRPMRQIALAIFDQVPFLKDSIMNYASGKR
jgi:2-octaprenyl-6-methoxyphenol hydroxylase